MVSIVCVFVGWGQGFPSVGEHYNSVLEMRRLYTTVSFLGIHKCEPDMFIGFSPALNLQCKCNNVGACILYCRGC